jgi:hypothetical protein
MVMVQLPNIARICPYLDRLDSVMDGEFCRMCKRDVHDLTDMDEAGRAAFISACGGDVCVSYVVRLKPALAAAALAAGAAALLAPGSAMAQKHRPKAPHAHKLRPPVYPLYVTGGLPPLIEMPAVITPPPVPPEPPVPANEKPRDPSDDPRTCANED